MRIELPMDYKFIVPDEGEPYILNSAGEKLASTLLTDTAVATAVYSAMQKKVEQLERLYEGMSMIAKTLEGEIEILENMVKLSGATDPYSKKIK